MQILRMSAALAAAMVWSMAAQAGDAPVQGMGRVYVRRVESDPVQFPGPLSIDSKRAKGPGHGACFYFDLAPGQHILHAMSEGDVTFHLEKGDVKYIQLEANEREIGGGSLDEIVPSAVDAFDTATCTAGDWTP